MSVHLKYAPSAAERWWHERCPGSAELADGEPSPETAESEEGTAGHSYAIRAIRDGLTPSSVNVQPENDELERMVRDVVRRTYDTMALYDGETIVLLTEFFMRSLELKDFGGTADVLIGSHRKRRLHVIDFKFGKGVLVPEASRNLQIWCYGALAAELFDWAELFVLHVWQPSRDAYSAIPASRLQLDAFRRNVALAQSLDTLRPGSWCQFCPAAAVCPALRKMALQTASFDFPEPVNEEQIEYWKELMVMAPVIRKVLDQVPQRMRRHMLNGEEVPGWKLVQSLGNRRWKYDEKEMFRRLRKLGIKKTLATEHKLKSPAKLETTKDVDASLLEELWERPDKGVVPVPESDSRQPFRKSTPLEDFDEVPSVMDDPLLS